MNEVISADEIKKTLNGYNPKKSEKYHTESAKLADNEFYRKIKENPHKEVILMCGGSASGKTEYLTSYLKDFKGITLDTTLSTKEGARIKIEKILRQNKTPIIVAVLPDNLKRSFLAFLFRDRKYPDKYFFETHSGARQTLLWIAQKHPDIEIVYIRSDYKNKKKMIFKNLSYQNKQKEIEFLETIQYTTSYIKQLVKDEDITTSTSRSQ